MRLPQVMANRKRREGEWTIGTERVAEVESFVYLGVEFGKRVGWKEMKSKVLSKVEGRIKKVKVLRSAYGLGIKETLRVWEAIGRPLMEYGAEVWANAKWSADEAWKKFDWYEEKHQPRSGSRRARAVENEG